MLDKTVGILVNRLVIGFVFAFIYQAVTGAATSALSIPLTGTIQDLITGLESADQAQSAVVILWWVISTILFTFIATQLVRHRKRISPYKGENIDTSPKITIVSLLILGATMSSLFFLLDLTIGATVTVSSLHTIYESALQGEYEPLAISILFSIVAGFVVVGVIGRGSKVSKITRDVGAISMRDIRRKFSRDDGAKTTADTSGLAPGTLVHVGKKRTDKVWFSVTQYGEDEYTEVPQTHDIDSFLDTSKKGVLWLNVAGVHDAEPVRHIGDRFLLHELYQADIMNTDLRPKIHVGRNNIFATLKMPYFDEDGNLIIEQISLVLGDNYVVSFQETKNDIFGKVRENIRQSRGNFRHVGSDYLAYALIDVVVDNFFVVMEQIGSKTEELEQQLMSNPGPETLQVIYTLKRQLVALRRVIWPMREVVNGLERSNSPLIHNTTKQYLRDVYSHAIQIMDMMESLRDMVGGMLDTYLSSVSNRMNEIMKTLTIIASIFIPITFVAGVYGTNFVYVPELEWEGSYFIMLGVMGAVSGAMIAWFRRKNWL